LNDIERKRANLEAINEALEEEYGSDGRNKDLDQRVTGIDANLDPRYND
jgi:hypothetical protein